MVTEHTLNSKYRRHQVVCSLLMSQERERSLREYSSLSSEILPTTFTDGGLMLITMRSSCKTCLRIFLSMRTKRKTQELVISISIGRKTDGCLMIRYICQTRQQTLSSMFHMHLKRRKVISIYLLLYPQRQGHS